MPAKKTEEKKVESPQKKRIAVIRIRGNAGHGHMINRTLVMLNLHNKHACAVVENTPSNLGMIKKVKDYVTWGEITDEVYNELIEKRAEPYLGRLEDSRGKIKYTNYLVYNNKKYRKSIRLSSPVQGFEKRGIKTSYANGGALGNRKDKINDLLKRMI